MQAIETRGAKRHQALLTFHSGLQDTTVLARNLKVAELFVEQHVWLLEQQAIHRGFRAQCQKVSALPFQNLEIPLRKRVLHCVVIILCIMKIHNI
jgi:hypothetical protein